MAHPPHGRQCFISIVHISNSAPWAGWQRRLLLPALVSGGYTVVAVARA